MNTEHRSVRAEVRAPDDDTRTFEAVIMRYGAVDDYDTVFDAQCFAASLEKRLPRITWGHDWADVIGRGVDFKDTDETLTIVAELDDFDAVPRARQAYAQLRSGTIDEFSVGFRRQETRDVEGRTHFVRAILDEAALVLSGAVPDTGLVAVRSRLGVVRQVSENLVIDLAKKVASGNLTHNEAAIALDLAAGGDPTQDGGSSVGGGAGEQIGGGTTPDIGVHEIDEALELAADDALEVLGIG